jgi:hypothetical protein
MEDSWSAALAEVEEQKCSLETLNGRVRREQAGGGKSEVGGRRRRKALIPAFSREREKGRVLEEVRRRGSATA